MRLAQMVYRVTSDNAGVTVPSVHSDFCLWRDDLPSSVIVTSKSVRSETAAGRLSWSLTKSVFRWTDWRLTVLLSSSELAANDPCRGNPGISASDWTELVTFSDDRSACNKHMYYDSYQLLHLKINFGLFEWLVGWSLTSLFSTNTAISGEVSRV